MIENQYLSSEVLVFLIYNLSSASSNGGAIMLHTLSSANITRCQFSSNHASGDGGAIYAAIKSELRVFYSKFTLNRAKRAGPIFVYMSDSLLEFCSFTSSKALEDGGCIHLKTANVTIKHSNLSRCRSQSHGISVYIFQQSTLRLENVIISGGLIVASLKSELFMTDSVLTGVSSDVFGGITCYRTSRVYLESVLITSCSLFKTYGCLSSYKCNVTLDYITIMDKDHAISAYHSNISIFNSLALNDTVDFLRAESSSVTLWNMNISGIVLDESVADFRHTFFVTLDTHCPITDKSRSMITLRTVYVVHAANTSKSESGVVCKGPGTVIHGNTSGKNVTLK